MPVRLSSPGLLWREWQESLLKKGGLPPPHPPSPENVSSGRAGRSLPLPCGERKRSPGGATSGARQGTSQDTGKATVQTNKASLFSALHFPHPSLRTLRACPRHTFSATARKKLPSQGAFSCAAASGRSARNKSRAGGVAGIFAVARRPPSVRYRDRVVVSHPPITRAGDGMEGRGAMALLPRRQRPHGRRSHSRRDEGSCGQRQPG